MALGIAHVHAQQVAREQSRFVAAGAGANLEKNIAIIVRIARQQQPLQLGFELCDANLRGVDLFLGERFHLRLRKHLLRALQIILGALVIVEAVDDGLDFRTLLAERAEAIHVARRVLARQMDIDLLEPLRQLLEFGSH